MMNRRCSIKEHGAQTSMEHNPIIKKTDTEVYSKQPASQPSGAVGTIPSNDRVSVINVIW